MEIIKEARMEVKQHLERDV